jgi:hypothetical protein
MRRVIRVAVTLAALWSGWWWLASTGAERAVRAWLDDRRAEGWQAETAHLTSGGYPFTLRLTADAPRLADPETGIAIDMSRLDASAPAWWPGNVTLRLPETPIRLSSPDRLMDLRVQSGKALLGLHPGPSLQLRVMQATSGPWQVTTPQGDLLRGADITLAMQQQAERAETYAFDIRSTGLTPGKLLRAGLASDWPQAFDVFAARVIITFDTPWDRHALQDRRPQPRAIRVAQADVSWGALTLAASGN